MNKLNNFFITVILICLMTTQVFASDCNSDYYIVQNEGTVEEHFINRANEILNRLPYEILKEFQDNGWNFYLTDTNLANRFYAGKFSSVQGTTDPNSLSIYIEDRDSAVEEATLHEFGHYVDFIRGGISETNEFVSIFNEESISFQNSFDCDFYYDIYEFFAEGFSMYNVSENTRETLRKSCPKLYNVIKDSLVVPLFSCG